MMIGLVESRWKRTTTLAAWLAAAVFTLFSTPARAYRPINPTMTDRTVVLDGRHLTIDEVADVARHGAKVAIRPDALRRSADAYGLLLEAAREDVPVYWFNRGSGAGRQQQIFSGDPTSADNRKLIADRELALFRRGAFAGLGPEADDEASVRAMLVVRANTMTYEAASPALTQMLVDLLNDRVTPVVQSRGTVGEGDLTQLMNVAATMVGSGDAYYRGVRMPAAEALRRAGLKPLAPFGADDSALESSNAWFTGRAALMVYDAREALLWSDLALAIDLDAMNSSVTPLSTPVRQNRPFKWANWDAARVLDMLKGSYLFQIDEQRIIQDPESLRASSIRQGSAWQSWAALRDDLLLQINSSDHNPAVKVGASPKDSWELATPELQQFFVKGGPLSHGEHGYVLSNANWDPFPVENDVEAFTIALANMDAAVAQRILRFTSTFFTVIPPLPPDPARAEDYGLTRASDYDVAALMQDVAAAQVPVSPEGNALVGNVEDLEAGTNLAERHARRVVDDTFGLLAEDLLTGTYWLDMRKLQDDHRTFGAAPTAVWNSFRHVVPFRGNASLQPTRTVEAMARAFIANHPAEGFYGAAVQQEAR